MEHSFSSIPISDKAGPSPVDNASFLSIVFFSWFTPLIRLGAKRPLEIHDIYEVPVSHLTTSSLSLFTGHYWRGPASLGVDLTMCFSTPLLLSNVVFLLYVGSSILQPFFVSTILEYVSNGHAVILGISSGVWIVLLLGAIGLVGILAFSMGFYYIQEFALYVRNTCIALIFSKSLRISSGSRSTHTTGEIVTLISVDAERIFNGVLLSTWYWMGPLLILGALILLIFQMGVFATLICCGVLLAWFWFQMNVGTWLGNIRDRMVKFTDERVKLTNEVLQGIRVVKLYAWETPCEERIQTLRTQEVAELSKYLGLKMINLSIQFVGPLVVSCVLFVSFHLLGGQLTVSKIYTTLSILNIIRLPIAIIPLTLASGEEAFRSLIRIKKYLSNPELQEVHSALPPSSGFGNEVSDNVLVSLQDASFSWNDEGCRLHESKSKSVDDTEGLKYHAKLDTDLVLRQVNLTIRRGEFIAVVGSVGSGKSSLLHSILGQLRRTQGQQILNAQVAYVGQEHWIQNLSVRDNVLFGSEYDEDRYIDTLDACELSKDLLSLPNADMTEIGERGITLSGGQKARVNIARALYAPNKDIYLFDDPLAAVDVHVGKKIFDHALQTRLRDKARVLVLSSNYHLLPHCDKIVVVTSGKVDVCDSYLQLKTRYPEYTSRDGEAKALEDSLAPELSSESDEDTASSQELEIASDKVLTCEVSQLKVESNDSPTSPSTGFTTTNSMSRPGKMKKNFSMYRSNRSVIDEKQKAGTVLTISEERQKGGVAMSTYWQYFASSVSETQVWEGYVTFGIVVVLFTIGQATRVFSDMWVGIWASNVDTAHPDHTTAFYMMWYIILIIVTAIFVFGRAQYFVLSCLKASHNLHHTLLDRLLLAPVNTYFDITPVGRILNRFSKDLDAMDSMLPDFFLQNVQNTFHIISVLILCIIASPYFIIMAVLLGMVFGYIQRLFSKSSREIKRLEGITRSPMYSTFGEMLVGLSTIRAYKKEKDFMDGHCKVADANNKSLFSYWIASRWLALRLDFVSNMIVIAVALIAVIVVQEGGVVNPTTLGLALVYSLQLASFLQWTVRCAIETENNMTAVERLLEFSKVPAEAARTTSSDPDVDQWPAVGGIVMRNLSLRYRPDLSRVLNNVTLTIPGGCKVGVCGRTGAGKSSLMLALFRIVEPEAGSVLEIDGINVLAMGLERLRSQLTIIPQDPVMFSGTLRYNLDPFERYSDAEVWDALDRAHLKEDVLAKFPDKLNHRVAERGENLSVGQRQLLCIARALLRKSKIIIMDEATASVDSQTDKKIQNSVRTAFRDCTVLTIAHRLDTIADYDRVVVMDAGQVSEFGVPYDLMQNESGIFASLVNALGPEVRDFFICTMRRRADSISQVPDNKEEVLTMQHQQHTLRQEEGNNSHQKDEEIATLDTNFDEIVVVEYSKEKI